MSLFSSIIHFRILPLFIPWREYSHNWIWSWRFQWRSCLNRSLFYLLSLNLHPLTIAFQRAVDNTRRAMGHPLEGFHCLVSHITHQLLKCVKPKALGKVSTNYVGKNDITYRQARVRKCFNLFLPDGSTLRGRKTDINKTYHLIKINYLPSLTLLTLSLLFFSCSPFLFRSTFHCGILHVCDKI